MNFIKNLLIFTSSLFILNFAFGTSPLPPEQFITQVENKKIILIDVREQDEIEQDGQIKSSQNIHFSDIQNQSKIWQDFVQSTKKDTPIYIYCRSGGRAGVTQKFLEKKGFSSVVNLGGLKDLVKQGYPLK